MSDSQQHELVNRLRVLLAHLLKWHFQYPRLSQRWAEIEGKRWRDTIIEQRTALRYLLEKNVALQAVFAEAIVESYGQAVDLAAEESDVPATIFPRECPYSEAQILERGFYPPR
jgi:hypothetical protein